MKIQKYQMFLFPDFLYKDFISDSIKRFESQGFLYLQDWTMDPPFTPERIKMPSGSMMDLKEIASRLKNLKLGDSSQLECLRSLEYLDCIDDLPMDDRTENYSSFLSDNDIEDCKIKYG